MAETCKSRTARSMKGVFPTARNVPWYEHSTWRSQREAIAGRVARKQEAAHARAVARKSYAKKNGLLPREVTNAMIGFA